MLLDIESNLRRKLLDHFSDCGISSSNNLALEYDKDSYRKAHFHQRSEKLNKNKDFVLNKWPYLSKFFASGSDIRPDKIDVRLEVVKGGTIGSDLFRLASLYWSVPVSEGYGRRLRFLVWDKSNEKIIGIFALGDAVFNIKSRDDFIGWTTQDRKKRLVNIMDAYVVGAIPPYNNILCGKLVASLIKSVEVADAFRKKYKNSVGLISGYKKNPYLTGVTLTSALGRSSVYNRLKLEGDWIFRKIGMTSGWGHFHVSDEIFRLMENYLKSIGDDHFSSYEFGGGPNWRIRVIKRALSSLGLSEKLMQHGYLREVYFSDVAKNYNEILLGVKKIPDYSHLKSVSNITQEAKARWVVPRSERFPEFIKYQREELLKALLN
jgi:hypothetical protein